MGDTRETVATGTENGYARRFVADLARFLVQGRPSWFSSIRATPVGTTISAGPGRIEGRILRSGRPAASVAIRLLLGQPAAWSVWAMTDDAGDYSVELPFGDYALWGAQITGIGDTNSLAGAVVTGPSWVFDGDVLTVTRSAPKSKGPELRFVEPIVLRFPRGDVLAEVARRLHWDAYPSAASYRVRMTEPAAGPTSLALVSVVLDHRFETPQNDLDLETAGVKLRPGVYNLMIDALDAEGSVMSTTLFGDATFRVLE